MITMEERGPMIMSVLRWLEAMQAPVMNNRGRTEGIVA